METSFSRALEAMMFKIFDHVEIVTDQLDRTVRFYTEVLDRLARVRGGRAESSYGGQGFEYVFLGSGVMSKRCCRFRANRSWTITAFSLAGTL
jgi:catechol 2,3-dioxygenase-like lactoylglutathione lyase family enzyme